MHLLCLTRITSEHSVKGGMEVHQKVLVEGLVSKGHTVTVITTRGSDGYVGKKIIAGVTYIFTDTPRYKKLATWYPLWYQESSGLIESIHTEDSIDVAWAEGGSAFGAMKTLTKLRIPYVPIAQGTIPGDLISYFRQINSVKGVIKLFMWSIIKGYLWLRYEVRYLKNASKVVVVSNELKQEMIKFYKLQPEHISVIFNGVSPEIFFPDKNAGVDIRTKYKIPQDAHVAVSAGRVIREKGFHLAIQALKEIIPSFPNTYLLILGKGVYEDELKKLSEDLHISDKVLFAGFVSRDEINRYYNAADCMISATLRNEGFPLIFCEAMLTGLPIIASPYGGNPSAVTNNETGYLLHEVSPTSLADAWNKLISNPEELSRLSENSLIKAQKLFTDTHMIDQTELLFEELVRS